MKNVDITKDQNKILFWKITTYLFVVLLKFKLSICGLKFNILPT